MLKNTQTKQRILENEEKKFYRIDSRNTTIFMLLLGEGGKGCDDPLGQEG